MLARICVLKLELGVPATRGHYLCLNFEGEATIQILMDVKDLSKSILGWLDSKGTLMHLQCWNELLLQSNSYPGAAVRWNAFWTSLKYSTSVVTYRCSKRTGGM